LRARPSDVFVLPTIALGEYLEGFADPKSAEAQALVSALELLPVTEPVAALYAVVTRELRAAGRLIGTNDLWIACTARSFGLPIVTRNVEHFARVPGLEVLSYSD
jgi:predicted nucleic acid-binding protein